MKRIVFTAVMAVSALILGSGAAQAAPDFTCTGASAGGTWHNVTVPPGATCTLEATRVEGDIVVKAGANLFINTTSSLDTTVAGNVSADKCGEVDFESTSTLGGRIVVGGNLTITNCTSNSFQGARGSSFSPPTPPPTVLIGGNVKCDNNPGGCVFDYAVISGNFECNDNFDCDLQSDAIGKNATINNNGGGFVFNSAIGGDIKCSGNTPAPSGSGNTIAGTKSGQCSTF